MSVLVKIEILNIDVELISKLTTLVSEFKIDGTTLVFEFKL